MAEHRERLHGKTVLVTGSTKGFGAAMARRFALEGAHVVLTGRSETQGSRLERDITREGHHATFVRADLTDETSVRHLVDTAVQRCGRLDALVNNAAAMDQVADSEQPIADMDTAGFERIIDVGIRGLFWSCKYAVAKLVESGGGSIVNVSSLAAVAGIPALPAYSMCKGAMGALTRQMATDYGHQGVRVNTMICGIILDPVLAADVAADPTAGPRIATAQLTRYGRLDDVAAMAGYLISDESTFVTGAEFRIDGGWTSTAQFPRLSAIVHGADTPAHS